MHDTQIRVALTPHAKQYKHAMEEGTASLGCVSRWVAAPLGKILYCQGNAADWRRRVLVGGGVIKPPFEMRCQHVGNQHALLKESWADWQAAEEVQGAVLF